MEASPDKIVLFVLWYVVFLLSLTCHEAAHAFVAWRGGDDTAFRAGQVTLNPIPHMMREPVGTMLVPLITFLSFGWIMGWASAPYDPHWGARHPQRAAVMAAAGPAANALLATIGFAALRIGLSTGFFGHPGIEAFQIDRLVQATAEGAAWQDGLGRFLSVLLVLNVALFLFNLLPFPPMDGASVLSGFFRPARRLQETLLSSPFASLLGLVIAWTVFPRILGPVVGWVIVRLYV